MLSSVKKISKKKQKKVKTFTKNTLNWGPIAAAAVAVGSQIIQTIMQNRANKKQMEKMNEYNTPKNQMARYQAAGLNPNLIYGQGTPGNQTSPTEQGVPNLDVMGPMAKAVALSSASKQNEMMDKQTRLLDQQFRINDAHIANVYAKTYNEDIKAMISRIRGEQLAAEQPYFKGVARYKAGKLGYELQKAEAESPHYGKMLKYSVDAKRTQILQLLQNMDYKKIQMMNASLDGQIKEQIKQEKTYYKDTRERSGIEKNDNIIFRAGEKAVTRINDWWHGH